MRLCHLNNLDLPLAVAELLHNSLADGTHYDWPLGRVDLDHGCFVNVEDGLTRELESARFEAHDRYVDLQLVIEGAGECMQWTQRSGLVVHEDLLADNDLVFFEEPNDAQAVISFAVFPQQLAVFMPEDAHKPSLPRDDQACQRRKYVYKIPISLFE